MTVIVNVVRLSFYRPNLWTWWLDLCMVTEKNPITFVVGLITDSEMPFGTFIVIIKGNKTNKISLQNSERRDCQQNSKPSNFGDVHYFWRTLYVVKRWRATRHCSVQGVCINEATDWTSVLSSPRKSFCCDDFLLSLPQIFISLYNHVSQSCCSGAYLVWGEPPPPRPTKRSKR